MPRDLPPELKDLMEKLSNFYINASMNTFKRIWFHEPQLGEHFWHQYRGTYGSNLIRFYRYLDSANRQVFLSWIDNNPKMDATIS